LAPLFNGPTIFLWCDHASHLRLNPLRRRKDVQHDEARNHGRRRLCPSSRQNTGIAGDAMRIMLADDHKLMLDGVRQTLEREDGFEVVGEAHKGPEVMPLVGTSSPEVVLLDMRMPGIDGLGLLQRLRARYPDVKVVMCSMSSDPDKIQSAFKHGACGYILKTINPADLGSAIRQAIEGTAYHALGLPAMNEDTVASAAGLTTRELDIVKGLARGLTNKAIALELWITVQTVKFHLTSVYRKLGITNRTEAARWALGKGLDMESESAL
jgi:two-component system nitrate/nitrite response regulator NarL